MPKRNMNPASLENLKMGAASRRQNKVACNLTLLPETVAWLKKGGNASARVDDIVHKILKGELVHRNQLDTELEKIKQLEGTDK
ncbi:hypothetical protein [Scytonema sp. NUACC26]|uniref:hypothetical protein n=1 Tax=Scytonema sp. NUACC26 TaxID=3140176 RepID=UPI0034DBA9AC